MWLSYSDLQSLNYKNHPEFYREEENFADRCMLDTSEGYLWRECGTVDTSALPSIRRSVTVKWLSLLH